MAVLLLILLVLLQVADIWTTHRVLERGGYEANPLVAWMMRRFGRLWWAPKVGLVLGLVGIGYAIHPAGGLIGATFAAAVHAAAVVNNLRQMGDD